MKKPEPLARARAVQRAAARQGFDWPRGHRGVWAKLREEIRELAEVAHDRRKAGEELGDLLFMVVNLSRHLGVDAGRALAAAIGKFERRYAHIERNRDRLPPRGDRRRLARMEALWQEAKRQERRKSRGKVPREATPSRGTHADRNRR